MMKVIAVMVISSLLLILPLYLTIWNLQVDKCNHPFFRDRNGDVYDSKFYESKTSTPLKLYEDVSNVLKTLTNQHKDIAIGAASRIKNICGAYQLLHLFNIADFFKYKHIYPGKKIAHFFHLHYRTGFEFKEMLFFDDDERNIRDVKSIGVPTYQVINGLTLEQLQDALKQFSITGS